ncbi:MAG: hypothetical protein H5U07_08355 [Candidatus Aminicenantes bacterium]|nr:hypothetical protein [Candidatus Aminicenantes bacterium]
MKKLIVVLLRAIFKPWKNGQWFEKEKTSDLWTKAFFGLLLLAVALALTSIIQAASGNFPAAPVFLPFSLENYFVWQAVFIIPWLLASWLTLSLLLRLIFVSGRRQRVPLNFKQLSAGLALSFYPFLFWLWLSHLLTAIFYSLGISQKEWVDLMSEPGWIQFIYIFLLFLALFSGLISSILTMAKIAPNGKVRAGFLGAGLSIVFDFLVLFFLR